MLVICNGMPRSASTWAFNVALGLIRRSEPSSEMHSGYDESLVHFLESAPPTAVHIVVKSHELDACGRALARAGAAKTIYTWRDPADAAVSCMRMFDRDFDRALAEVESSLALYSFHRRWGTALIMEYAEIMAAPRKAVSRIADYLGFRRSSAVVRTVANETSFERTKEKVNQLDAGGDTRLTRHDDLAYDPETLLHPGHIRDGSSGYGRRALTLEQVERCDALLARYVQVSEAGAA